MPEQQLVKMPLLPIRRNEHGLKISKVNKRRKKRSVLVIGIIVAIILIITGIAVWYNWELGPLDNTNGKVTKITVENGSTLNQVADQLQEKSIIRSAFVFDIYTRINGESNSLKAGTYRLSSGESVQQIVAHLIKGNVDQFSITFYPGATLVDNSKSSKKYDVTTQLVNQGGYTEKEISTALAKTYISPLFVGKPAGTSLEGYVYGETYKFNTGASVQDILQRTFDEFDQQIKDNDLVAGFAKQGLSLYQGITLASIVQREASNAADQRQVAQVFLLRLKKDMPLGSDVTYYYIADKLGIPRTPLDTSLDSPYNTRRYAGLPPGPISSPGITALRVVANPASGDYLYFLAGDDGVIHLAYTEAQHEDNISKYCKIGCTQ